MSGLAVRLSRAAVPLGLLAFWGGLLMAAARYPTEFDWRYMTISNLVSVAGNPTGHLGAALGIAVCGIGIWWWAAQWSWRRKPQDRPLSRTAIWALCTGIFCMAAAAVVPQSVLRIPKGHEILALLAFIALCVAIVELSYHAAAHRAPAPSRARIYAGIVAGAALLPVVLAALAQLYVNVSLPQLPWVSLKWRDAGIPVYLSFAFWEWATCAIFSAYLLVLPQVIRSNSARVSAVTEQELRQS